MNSIFLLSLTAQTGSIALNESSQNLPHEIPLAFWLPFVNSACALVACVPLWLGSSLLAQSSQDLALFNANSRQTAIWYLNGVTYAGGAYVQTALTGWSLQRAGDFNADGNPDFAIFKATTGQTAIWYLYGPWFWSSVYGPTLPTDWTLQAVDDSAHPRGCRSTCWWLKHS